MVLCTSATLGPALSCRVYLFFFPAHVVLFFSGRAGINPCLAGARASEERHILCGKSTRRHLYHSIEQICRCNLESLLFSFQKGVLVRRTSHIARRTFPTPELSHNRVARQTGSLCRRLYHVSYFGGRSEVRTGVPSLRSGKEQQCSVGSILPGGEGKREPPERPNDAASLMSGEPAKNREKRDCNVRLMKEMVQSS
jgi:hypothetical protein